ncbi:MAG: PilN domain-containing protein [Phycisphaerae bacterium]
MSTINLLPRDYIKRRLQRRADVLLLMLFGIVMLGVISAAILTERSWRHTVAVAERVDQSYVEAARLIEQLQQLDMEKQNMLTKAEQTASLMEKVPRSYLLAAVSNALPSSASLTGFHLTVDKVEQSAGPPAGAGSAPGSKFQSVASQRFPGEIVTRVNIEVTGLAETDVDVARFLTNMSANPLVSSADLVYSEERIVDDDTVMRGFRVDIALKPGADAIEAIQAEHSAAPDGETPSAGRS